MKRQLCGPDACGIPAGVTLLLLLTLAAGILRAQPKIDMVGLARGDSVILIPGAAPEPGEGINFYRKTGNTFTLLNTEGPVLPITDAEEISGMFGSTWDDAAVTLGISSPEDLVYLLSQDPTAFFIISFQYPEIFRIAGCWYVDKGAGRFTEAVYKLEYVTGAKTIRKAVTATVRAKESSIPVPTAVTIKEENGYPLIEWQYPAWTREYSDVTVQFRVYRKTGGGSFARVNTEIIPRNSNASPRFVDESAENGTAYIYHVRAVDITGAESVPSAEVTVALTDKQPPVVPDGVKADSSAGAIGISWNMNLEQDAAGYLVYRSLKLDREYDRLTPLLIPVDKTFYYDSTITFGIQYFYTITCTDKSGNESPRSNALAIVYEDAVPPAAPAAPGYTINTDNSVTLTWQPSASADVEGYHIYRGESREVLPRITGTAVKQLSYTDRGFDGKGLQPGKAYTFAVTAYDRGRNESSKAYLDQVVLADTTPPAAPEGFIIENMDGAYVQVYCGGSTSADAVRYTIYKWKPGARPTELAVFTAPPFNYRDSAVSKGEAYIYSAVAADSAGNISRGGKADTVQVRDFTAPPSPRVVKAKTGTSGITVSWEASFDYDLAGYYVYKSPVPNGSYTRVSGMLVTGLTFTDPAGKKGEYYRVRAVDTSGNESTRGEYAAVQ